MRFKNAIVEVARDCVAKAPVQFNHVIGLDEYGLSYGSRDKFSL